MVRDDEIDAQVSADWEFTRRAQQLMSRLQTQGITAGRSTEDPVTNTETDGE